jgi:aspartate/methionine/tyrosine aminotransferase
LNHTKTLKAVDAAGFRYIPPDRIRRLDVPERSPVLGVSLREAERRLENNAKDKTLVDLTYADTKRFPPPEWALPAFAKAATAGGFTYTPYRGSASVRPKLADNLSEFLGITIDPDRDLIITPGSQAALFTALAAIVEKGDTVVITDPDYLTNERMLRFLGADVLTIPLQWEHGGSPSPDLNKLETAFRRRPRAMLFSNPNNPTGAVYEPAVVRAIAQLALEHDVLLIVDELYSRLVYDGRPFLHLATVDGMRERSVTLLGPSKTESMSGYRLGVAIAPPGIIDRMEDVQSVAALRAPAYAQHTLVHWLADDRQLVRERVVAYQALRDYTVKRLRETEGIQVVPSGGTSYLFPRFLGFEARDQEVALRLQNEAGVIVNPGYQSGQLGAGHFRICFAQNETTFPAVMDRICDTLRAMRRD